MATVFEMPPIHAGQTEKPKVKTFIGNDEDNIVMSIILPYEVTGDLDTKKGLILRKAYLELEKMCKELNSSFGAENKSIFDFIQKRA